MPLCQFRDEPKKEAIRQASEFASQFGKPTLLRIHRSNGTLQEERMNRPRPSATSLSADLQMK